MSRSMQSGRPEFSPWYETAFNELYPLLYQHRDDDSARREARAILRLTGRGEKEEGAAPLRVLDICCGAGRHAAALAEMGLDVWGADLSRNLLAEALRRPALRGRIVQSEIRALPFQGVFGLALNLFTSFGYFAEEEENRRALVSMVRTLRPGGLLVLDHINRVGLESRLVGEDAQEREGRQIRQRRWIEGDRVRKIIEVTDRNGRVVEIREDVRLYHPGEMIQLGESAGLERARLLGDFGGAPLTPDSPRMILLAVRA